MHLSRECLLFPLSCHSDSDAFILQRPIILEKSLCFCIVILFSCSNFVLRFFTKKRALLQITSKPCKNQSTKQYKTPHNFFSIHYKFSKSCIPCFARWISREFCFLQKLKKVSFLNYRNSFNGGVKLTASSKKPVRTAKHKEEMQGSIPTRF